jgi:hypothetical protein
MTFTSVSPVVYVAGYWVLDPLPYHFNLQQVGAATPFLAFDLETSPTLLLEMARDDDRDKHPWSEDSSRGSQFLRLVG